jgi:hypothetical protein
MAAIPAARKIACAKGSIAESAFNEPGIEIDQTKDGRPAVRNDGAHISHQRAVIITHDAQQQQRTAERQKHSKSFVNMSMQLPGTAPLSARSATCS